MGVHTIRTRLIVGAVAAAAVVAPLSAALATDSAHVDTAGPRCLAWFGNKDDGQCLGYSQGGGAQIGTPSIGINGNGFGVSTGPLLPGTSFNSSFG